MKALLTAGLGTMLLAGCYTYRPLGSVEAAMPVPGTQVEVRLTTAGATALASQVGPDILLLQGQIVTADSAGLTLAVSHTQTARRISSDWKGEHVTLPRQDIASVQGRKLSVGGTALLGGLAGGGILAAAALIGGSGTSGTAGGPPPQGPQ
jgi:hypothetical protein